VTGRRWVALGVLALGLVWGLGGEAVSISRAVEENHFLDFLTGFSFFLGGAIAVDRRPGNLLGPLMVLNGLAWFCGNYLNASSPCGPRWQQFGEALDRFATHHVIVEQIINAAMRAFRSIRSAPRLPTPAHAA